MPKAKPKAVKPKPLINRQPIVEDKPKTTAPPLVDEVKDVDPAEGAGEEMSDDEANAMFNRAEKRKEEATAKAFADVDQQDWTRNDPFIPVDLLKAGKVWVSVYKCPNGHKTKATNRQAEQGIFCWQCKETGKQVKATLCFLGRPENDRTDEKDEKREKAKRGTH